MSFGDLFEKYNVERILFIGGIVLMLVGFAASTFVQVPIEEHREGYNTVRDYSTAMSDTRWVITRAIFGIGTIMFAGWAVYRATYVRMKGAG